MKQRKIVALKLKSKEGMTGGGIRYGLHLNGLGKPTGC